MNRFRLMLVNELKLARTALPVHVIAIVQPSVFFLLMSLILVHPTFDLNVVQPTTEEGRALVAAMREVGSPVGEPYIEPIPVSSAGVEGRRQTIAVEVRDGIPTAVQRYGLIDSNQVKNMRNRLTAAALRVWNERLGERAVTVEEHPWLLRDISYDVYFGLALLPLAAFMSAAIIGGVLTAQDFEFNTIMEYRAAPVSPGLILGARLARLILSTLIAAGVLLLAMGLSTGVWPGRLGRVILTLTLIGVTASSLGVTLGLLFRRTLPTFVVGLTTSVAGWIFGSSFGLAAGFGGWYERISRLTPNTHAVELLFPCFYQAEVGRPWLAFLVLAGFSLATLALVIAVYRRRVIGQG
jgi:ABC-type multidrug transport system permease subunit